MTPPSPKITLRQALLAVRICQPVGQRHGFMASPVHYLADGLGVAEKVALKKLEGLAHKGYIEYGVSVGYPWLTDKGTAKLVELVQADEVADSTLSRPVGQNESQ